MSAISEALTSVRRRVAAATAKRTSNVRHEVRLVAVSKTKPVEDIIEAYQNGQRDFGENYVQELVEKANNEKILKLCPEIRWHLIGHLQRNKVPKIVALKNLSMVETVDSTKLAEALNTARQKYIPNGGPLSVMIQVNTSNEEAKSGIVPEDAPSLAEYIKDSCRSLKLVGVMTIGAYDYDVSLGPNPDFLRLITCRNTVSSHLGIDAEELELSMGMSSDYEHAIELGSTNIRVGSTIFGARNYSKPSVEVKK
ncbi:pyridoxal phosphate homeostasis protein-like [Artemia franciscana]|uniref:Pyridoxal phosphate homeostasis protein n=1 Tax=Artemia franciscana TaxID=6661 RepID=A0AA88HVR1_ARTSF|nr:hypothetical protein QYM36_012739 [Artemia franciscana]